jgi:hypothetical protein
MTEKTQQQWTAEQFKYIQFVARGNKTINGDDRTEEQFAKAIGVDRVTLWRWSKLPGFRLAVFDEVMGRKLKYLDRLVDSQIMAAGKKGKGGETQAFLAIMRQAQLLQSDKVDHTTNGKDLPTPVLPIGQVRDAE